MEEKGGWKNKLYFGDNLTILRDHVADETVDLIYLDPPFNSNANYNVLFGQHKGDEAGAQITAFEDTWHWGLEAEGAYKELVDTAPPKLVELVQALRSFLGQSDMMAYLCMMALRLVEHHRVLKSTGSLYLHCDPTASHYLKLILDAIFDPRNYVNEIVWKRSDAHSDSKQGSKHFGRVHDVLLFYRKTEKAIFQTLWNPLPQRTADNWYRNVEPGTGRRFNKADVTGPGGASKGNPFFEWKGVSRYWRYSLESMQRLEDEGKLIYSKSGMPYEKRYLDESKGVPVQDWWDDISMLRGITRDGERLGYPTQKPEALLDRIIRTSSNEGDLVLDGFCGCGTTVVTAERNKRRWIGIDITHLAIALMKSRLQDTFGYELSPFEVLGVPKDLGSARELAKQDRYHFEWWALSLVNARPAQDKKKGADTGVDGLIYFHDDESGIAKKAVVQVKSGHVSSAQVRDLKGVMEREKAKVALFVTLEEPTEPMNKEAATAAFYEPEHWQGRGVPRLQILTIDELLGGKRPELPRYAPEATFKQAPRKKPDGKQGKLW